MYFTVFLHSHPSVYYTDSDIRIRMQNACMNSTSYQQQTCGCTLIIEIFLGDDSTYHLNLEFERKLSETMYMVVLYVDQKGVMVETVVVPKQFNYSSAFANILQINMVSSNQSALQRSGMCHSDAVVRTDSTQPCRYLSTFHSS